MMHSVMQWLLACARWQRISFVFFVAVLLVLVASPLVDRLYIQYFFDDATVIVPSYVSVFLGAIAYLWGWVAIVGVVGDSHRPTTIWAQAFVVFSFCVMVISIVLIVQGLSMTDFVAG